MIYGVDSSTFIRALEGLRDRSTILLRTALRENAVRLPPIVVTELMSAPPPMAQARRFILTIPRLPIMEAYWERAGELRRGVLAQGKAARIADALIAQSCIDHDIPLITYDRDFERFERAGLKLL